MIYNFEHENWAIDIKTWTLILSKLGSLEIWYKQLPSSLVHVIHMDINKCFSLLQLIIVPMQSKNLMLQKPIVVKE